MKLNVEYYYAGDPRESNRLKKKNETVSESKWGNSPEIISIFSYLKLDRNPRKSIIVN